VKDGHKHSQDKKRKREDDDDNTKDVKKPKVTREKRDPELPKRPMNAYLLWVAENRGAVAKEENLKGNELTQRLGELWAKVGEDEKKPYEAHAKSLKEDYDEKKSEYKKTHPNASFIRRKLAVVETRGSTHGDDDVRHSSSGDAELIKELRAAISDLRHQIRYLEKDKELLWKQLEKRDE